MIRKPNARRNEDLARALSVARDTGSGSTQNLSRIIEAVREKPSTDGATVAMLNKLMRAKTSGNSDALRRAMKEIEDLKRTTPVTNRVNDKQKKIAELEKYVVNKGGKLNTQRRVAFMNDAQKSIKAYKNGTNMYNTAKTRITAAYETAYKANLNNMGPKKAIDALQKTVNTIGNSKIKTSAREKLNVFIQSSASDRDARNAVIKLKKLDEELGKRKVNRVYLNDARDEALKNINSYNIKNGLAKINRRVQEDMKKRGVEFNELIKNDAYKNVPKTATTPLRNKYVSGELNINGVKRGLNNALEETAGVFKGLENKIANLETKLENSKLTANERNALKKELNNSRQRRNTNAKNMNVMREQLGNMKTNINTKARNIEKLKNELAKSASPNVRNKLKSSLNQALKNQFQSQREYQALQNEKKRKNAIYKQLREEKLQSNKNLNLAKQRLAVKNANLLKKNQQVTRAQLNIKRAKAEIAELTKKLQNGSISNKEKEELAKARGNALTATEELQKLQEEKKSFNAEIAKAKENVEAARAAQSAANRNRNVKVAQAKESAEASITKAQNNASLKIQEATNKVQNLQNKLTKRTNLTPNQVQNLRKQINNAKANAVRVKQNANTSVAAAQAAAQESMNALRIQANKEVANARSQANAATKAASKAEAAVVTAQNQLTQAQTNLAQQQANVNRIQQELNEKTNMSEKQRANLEQQLLIERRQVANAQKLTQNAKSNANAAVAESRRLVAEAGKAANEASARAAQAEAQRQTALGNKAEAIRLKANANTARKVAQAEAKQSANAAAEASRKASEISRKLEIANLNKAQMTALIKKKNALLERRQKEMQNQINIYKTQANRITALESNRNKWQAEYNLAKQSLNVKNANLLKKIDEINKTQSNLARLQKELNNTKTASAAEKNAIKTQLEAEKQNLARQFTQTQTDLKSTKSELIKLTKNRNILFKELQNRSGTLLQTREERNKLKQQLEETKKILRNTQNNLGQLALAEQRTRGQRNTLSRKLANVRGQRQNLRSRNNVSRKVIAGLTQQRQDAQRGINTLRATTRNLERRRLATDRATNKTFNASAAFNRQMKGVAPRQSWQSLKPKATMVGAVQADVLGKRLREKLLKNIDTTNISGKFVINGGPLPGSERRALKKEVQDPMTRLNKLRAIEKRILNKKTNRNSTILQRRRMNKVLNKQGTNVKPVNPNQNIGRSKLQGFAASGLNQKTISDVIRRL